MERILVAQTGFLGDVVLTTPLLQAIRRQVAPEFLGVLCTPDGAELLRDSSFIDRVIPFDKRGKDAGIPGLLRLAGLLRELRLTRALAPHRSVRTAALLLISGIRFRVGFRESMGWFLYHATVRPDQNQHSAERILSLGGPLGVKPTGREGLSLTIDESQTEAVGRLLRGSGIVGDKPIFGIQPGSVWKTKRWTVEGYAQIAVDIRKRYGAQVVMLGGSGDRGIAEAISRQAGQSVVNLAGLTTLRDMMAILKRLKMLITNDTGPMHMAVALGVPVVAIFCSTTLSLGFYPYTNRAVVIEKILSCRPCSPHGGHRCPIGTEECMRGVQAGDVLRGMDLLLQRENFIPKSTGPGMPLVVSV